MLKRKNDRQPPQRLEEERYPNDYWLDEEDGGEDIPEPADSSKPVSGRLHSEPRSTSVRRLNKLYFAYTDLSPEVQQAYKELISYCGGVEDLLQKSEEFLFYPECHNIMDVARYRLEHNIEFSALSEKGKKYFNLEAYAHELEEKGRYALCNNGMFKL